MLQVKVWNLALIVLALCGCSKAVDDAVDLRKLTGIYRAIASSDGFISRKEVESSSLTLFADGTFNQQCKYLTGKIESINGVWKISDRNIQFSVFRDCLGVWPTPSEEGLMAASLIVDLRSPTSILLSPDINVRYERIE